jgi:hypothetical protein
MDQEDVVVDADEVNDNIINSTYVVHDELLLKNSKVLRHGKELKSSEEWDDISIRISNVLKQ